MATNARASGLHQRARSDDSSDVTPATSTSFRRLPVRTTGICLNDDRPVDRSGIDPGAGLPIA